MMTRVVWLVVGLCASVSVLLLGIQVSNSRIVIAAVAYACGLLPVMLISVTWLMLTYRRFFQSWRGWFATVAFLVVSSVPITQPTVSAILVTGLLIGMWAIGIATIILLYYRDVGLSMFAYASALTLWILVFAWRFQGNLVELWINGVTNPTVPSPLWWLNPVWCVVGWAIPLSLLGAIAHTVRLFVRELRQ